MSFLSIPTPDQLQAYALALTAIGVALGGIGGAIILFVQRLRAEVRAFQSESTANHQTEQTQLVGVAQATGAPVTIATVMAPVVPAQTANVPPPAVPTVPPETPHALHARLEASAAPFTRCARRRRRRLLEGLGDRLHRFARPDSEVLQVTEVFPPPPSVDRDRDA